MTALDSKPQTDPDTDEPTRRRRRRRPAPKANPFFRFVFPLLVVIAAVVVGRLAVDGRNAVFDTTDGTVVEVATDPAEPGFLAFATPTPTMLIAHVDSENSLVGVTVLARTALDDGGSIALLSTDLLLDPADADPVVLGAAYAADGVVALENLVGELFGFGFTEDPMVINPDGLGVWLGLVEPIPFRLTDDLVAVNGDGTHVVAIDAGASEFDGATLAEVYDWRNPDESDANRFTRQAAVWTAWLRQVGLAEDLVAATLGFDTSLPAYLKSLGAGTADIEIAPMTPVRLSGERPFYVFSEDDLLWPAQRATEMVRLPIEYRPGARPRVQVLDGTGNAANRVRMIPAIVAAGAEIWIIGNAPVFDVAETTVRYHQVEDEALAVEFAKAIDAIVEFDDDPNQPDVVLTVTIGADFAVE